MNKKFGDLYRGNTNSFGQWNPKNGNMYTKKESYTDSDIANHLSGKMGIGLVPIDNDDNCWWGAIDIDNHSGVDVDVPKIVKMVHDLGLPLIVCKSKSGGAHCYLFGLDPLPAHFVRQVLAKWASDLGFQGSEVFPKQSKLKKDKKTKVIQLGNWINLPYFNTDQRVGYKIKNGDLHQLTFNEFITRANSLRVNQRSLKNFMLAEHQEAPPCIQMMMMNGIDSGYRNEGLYNLTVYFRKAFPDDFEARAFDINQTIFEKPLSFAEAKKTVKSASNKTYRYKCMEEPCREFCDSDECLKKEHGITKDEMAGLSRADMPNISDLKIYDMEPPIWEMKINGVVVNLTTAQFYNYQDFAKTVMEKLLIMIPPMKSKDWLNVLAGLMNKVERVETPDDAGTPGVIKKHLKDFLSKADLSNNGKDSGDRQMILRGIPVVQRLGIQGVNGRNVVFLGTDFISYLKRAKSESIQGSMLWGAMKNFGVDHTRIRIAGRITSVWAVPIDDYNRTKLDMDYLDEDNIPENMREEGHNFKVEF